jgi:hypothetical protein
MASSILRLFAGTMLKTKQKHAFHNKKIVPSKNNTNNPAGCPRTGF